METPLLLSSPSSPSKLVQNGKNIIKFFFCLAMIGCVEKLKFFFVVRLLFTGPKKKKLIYRHTTVVIKVIMIRSRKQKPSITRSLRSCRPLSSVGSNTLKCLVTVTDVAPTRTCKCREGYPERPIGFSPTNRFVPPEHNNRVSNSTTGTKNIWVQGSLWHKVSGCRQALSSSSTVRTRRPSTHTWARGRSTRRHRSTASARVLNSVNKAFVFATVSTRWIRQFGKPGS